MTTQCTNHNTSIFLPQFYMTVDMIVCDPFHTQFILIERGRDPHKGMLAFPGGFVDAGETVAEAGRRELREEIGLNLPSHVEPWQLPIQDDPHRDPRGLVISVPLIFYIPRIQDVMLAAGDDAANFVRVSFKEFSDAKLAFDHDIIRDEFFNFLAANR